MTGQSENQNWRTNERKIDIYDLKGILGLLLEGLDVDQYGFQTVSVPWLDEETSMQIICKDRRLGLMGRLSDRVDEIFDLKRPVFVTELDLDYLIELARPGRYHFRAIPKFPPVLRDLAIIIEESITFRQVLDLIRKEGGRLLQDVSLFDVYVGRQIPKGKKSLAFSLTYRSDKKTLTDAEVNEVHQRIFERLNAELNAELR
jgi:phenylalanyl-tRNA synthetase beta chain